MEEASELPRTPLGLHRVVDLPHAPTFYPGEVTKPHEITKGCLGRQLPIALSNLSSRHRPSFYHVFDRIGIDFRPEFPAVDSEKYNEKRGYSDILYETPNVPDSARRDACEVPLLVFVLCSEYIEGQADPSYREDNP